MRQRSAAYRAFESFTDTVRERYVAAWRNFCPPIHWSTTFAMRRKIEAVQRLPLLSCEVEARRQSLLAPRSSNFTSRENISANTPRDNWLRITSRWLKQVHSRSG